ncbi:MAG TPA: prepilin peptidase [Paracoccaceae bacterium]|nr:prepilin peptidase [Paracoccaceae bacterium]
MMVTMFGAAVFAALMICAALGDIRDLQISNRLVLAIVAAFAVFAPFAGVPLMTVATSLAVATGVLAVGFVLFALGWMGGGDAKLAATAALWLGAGHVLPFVVMTALAGGALAIAIIGLRSVPIFAFWPEPDWARRLRSGEAGLPYGVAIAAGALMVLGDTGWAGGF